MPRSPRAAKCVTAPRQRARTRSERARQRIDKRIGDDVESVARERDGVQAARVDAFGNVASVLGEEALRADGEPQPWPCVCGCVALSV